MTKLYITIDTEYSVSMARKHHGEARQENFDRSIRCATSEGEVGIHYQMDVLDRHGLKAVFFVDPMPALLWGVDAIADIVRPIIARGHDVQLHVHAEWLTLAGTATPLGAHMRKNLKDFSFEDQCWMLDYGRSILMAAGAPAPTAFRAGNYGANDDTLRALAQIGLLFDSSHAPGVPASDRSISLGPEDLDPQVHCGVIEVPVGCIRNFDGQLRHAQLAAISASEICAALRHAVSSDIENFTLVSHSFELLSRDRRQINRMLRSRFEKLCAWVASMPDVVTATYANDPPGVRARRPESTVLPPNLFRATLRLAEQAFGNTLYGRG